MNRITEDLLSLVTDYQGKFTGAYNIRVDGGCAGRASTENIKIVPHSEGKPGIEVHVAPGTKGKGIHSCLCYQRQHTRFDL